MSDALDSLKDKASDVLGKAAAGAGEVQEQVSGVVQQVTGKVSELAEQHGDKVTGAVGLAKGIIDDKTGGKLTPVTDKVEDVTNKIAQALGASGDQETS
ncbi:MAG: Rv0909 family putative TA system antitoxin [Candidatus Nanopelagicales bacterium]|nr:Rv0909 family putative TA system antitoxin [Candidatus Nanopelagicales bacterium]